jgi:hypothetical protein
MKLVETDTEGPEPAIAEDGPPTPPRPERRRTVTSLVLTLAVLIGTVVAVYAMFPPRHNLLMTTALENHRSAEQPWQLQAPSASELDAWALGVLGGRLSLPRPGGDVAVIGARSLEVLRRTAVLVRYEVGGDEVSYVVQRAGILTRAYRHADGADTIVGWRSGPWICIVIGPAASAERWGPPLGVP